jgi:hypothetical protein
LGRGAGGWRIQGCAEQTLRLLSQARSHRGQNPRKLSLQSDERLEQTHHVVHLGTYREFSDLDTLMERFQVERCVIDGLPETHATRQFALRHHGNVYLCFFKEDQRGKAQWDWKNTKVEVNRTEALDASRAAVRDGTTTLPRRDSMVETFARHMTCDAKKLEEDEETGARRYRYIKT